MLLLSLCSFSLCNQSLDTSDILSYFFDSACIIQLICCVLESQIKDKEGKVIAVDKKDGRVLVEGVNMLTKHTKPSMANQNGGIVHQEGYIDASNVMLLHNGKATRVGFKMDGDKKVRFAKATGEVID